MPGEVAEETFGLVAGANGKRMVLRREIEQHYHAHARHYIAAPRCIGVWLARKIPVNGGGDVDGSFSDSKCVDHQLRMLHRLRAASAIRHSHRYCILSAEGPCAQGAGDRGIHATRHPDHRFLEPTSLEFSTQKCDEPLGRKLAVQPERWWRGLGYEWRDDFHDGYSRSPARSRERSRCGSIVRRSASSGDDARARVMSPRSSVTGIAASSHSGARARTSPSGPATTDPPGNAFPPSLPVSWITATNTPCSSAR